MLFEIIHKAYHAVETIMEEVPGPDPESGKVFVAVGALLGLGFFPALMGSLIESDVDPTAYPSHHGLVAVLFILAGGAVSGALVGLLIWMAVLSVSAWIKRSSRT